MIDNSSSDPYDLNRFVEAQSVNYSAAIAELRAGRKTSHWMWYVFPQVAGLGRSPMSERYAIRSEAEARAYLAHPLLGSRLIECFDALLNIEGKTAREIMGAPDDLKLKSSATLFTRVSDECVFQNLLNKYFNGEQDIATLSILSN